MKKISLLDYRMLRIDRTMAMASRKYSALYRPLAFEFQIELNHTLAKKISDVDAIYLDAWNKRKRVLRINDSDLPF